MAPKVMLLDQPTSILDPEKIKELLDTTVSLAEEGITMICVTHEMGFARQVAHRVIFMASDEIIEEAPPAEVFVAPLHERTRIFLGDIAPRHESKLRRFAIDAYPHRIADPGRRKHSRDAA